MHTTDQPFAIAPTAVLSAGLLLLSSLTIPAGQAQDPRSSGIKMLEAFTGQWKLDEMDEETPFGPAGRSSFETSIRFVHDGQAMEEAGAGTFINERGDSSPYKYTIVYSYDREAHAVRALLYDSLGTAAFGDGTLNERGWETHWTQHANDRDYKCKYASTLAPDGSSWAYEMTFSEDGVSWKPWFKGTATRVGEATITKHQSARDAIVASNSRFEHAFLHSDTAAIAKFYTRDARSYIPGAATVNGNEAIAAGYRQLFEELKPTKAKVQTMEVHESNGWAYETGTFVVTGEGGNTVLDNKYLCIWTIEDGEWRIHREIGNGNPVPGELSAEKGIPAWHKKYAELCEKGDGKAVAELYTEDAEMYSGELPALRGRAEIQRLLEEDAERIRETGDEVQLTNLAIAQNGDSAYNICKVVERRPDGTTEEQGIAVGFWKRIGGEWKLHRDFWSPSGPTPEPTEGSAAGPEQKKMEVWVGNWTYEGEAKASPWGPAGKMKGRESSRMILNGFVYQDEWRDEVEPAKWVDGITLLRYAPELKAYVDYTFASDGSGGMTTNTVSGNVWTGLGAQTDTAGKRYQTRFVRVLADDGKTSQMKAEYSEDGQSWSTWWELTNRKLDK